MTLTHLHLMINHLPIIGSLLGGLVLAHGMGTKSFQTNIAAYYIMVLSAIGATIAYFTGEPAEKTIENTIGNIQNQVIERHEEMAELSMVSIIILGLVSIIGLYVIYKKLPTANLFAKIIMVICIYSFVLVSRTGYLGGLIRHTELEKAVPFQNQTEKEIRE